MSDPLGFGLPDLVQSRTGVELQSHRFEFGRKGSGREDELDEFLAVGGVLDGEVVGETDTGSVAAKIAST